MKIENLFEVELFLQYHLVLIYQLYCERLILLGQNYVGPRMWVSFTRSDPDPGLDHVKPNRIRNPGLKNYVIVRQESKKSLVAFSCAVFTLSHGPGIQYPPL